jgi:preprotein translocase SecE subunit
LNLSSDQLRQSFSFRFKRWFFGVGKEFSRVTWIRGKQVLKDFGIILILVAIMALIFLGLDYIINMIPRG